MSASSGKMKRTVKKRFGALLRDRLFVGGTLLLLQMLFMVFCIFQISAKWLWVYRSFTILSIGIVIWLIRKYDNPAYKLAWIIVIMAFPLFGGIFYLSWGNTPLNRARKLYRQESAMPLRIENKDAPSVAHALAELRPDHAGIVRYIERTCGLSAWDGSQAAYFRSGEEKLASMLTELPKAERFIFLEYFILEEGEMWNSILDILVAKAAQGVDVRVLYDDAGCLTKLPAKYDLYLQSLGLQAIRFNRFIPTLNTYLNHRDHRKQCIIDGNVAYTGGINLADEYINRVQRYGYWKDTGVLVRGAAVVNMTEMFLRLWEISAGKSEDAQFLFHPTQRWASDGYIQPFGDSPMDDHNVGETVYMRAINSARRYVYITTPYLVLDNEMITALITAAQSGIDVRIITPGIPDKPMVYAVTRSFYQQLMKAGVRIYEYEPGFMHAKMIVTDDDLAVVGTINMDFRSFYLHFECGTLFYQGKIPLLVRQDIESCFQQSREMDEAYLHQIVPWPQSIVASILRLLAPLM